MNKEDIRQRIVISGYIIIVVFFAFTLRLWQLQVLKGKEYLKISESNRMKVLKVPAPRGIIYDRNGIALVKNTPFYSVSLIPGSTSDIDLSALAQLISLDEEELAEKISTDVPPFDTIKIKEGIPFAEVAYVEARRSDFPGLIIEPEITRHYVYGNVSSHVVGYLGMPGPDKLKNFQDSDIPPDAFIGKWGIEAYYDEKLRGVPGKKYIEVDALGRQLRIVREEPSQKGDDLVLTIDIHLQKKIEEAIGEKTGASVVLDPKNGEVLALVSLPSFDPNLFSRGISAIDWIALNKNPYHPFLNRAVQSQFPPGSVFKIVVAAAALEEDILPQDFKVKCSGKIRYGRWDYRCWKRWGHGVVALHRGIVESCDVFFYTIGGQLGVDTIAEYALKFGFGKPRGIKFVDEKSGFIPTASWKEKVQKKPWYIGETYHSAIGQGYVLTTPIQQAFLISAVANGGVLYRPKIIKDSEEGVIIKKIELKSTTLETIREALKGVVNEKHGTGWAARSRTFVISGKTGTAQVIRQKGDEKEEDLPEKFRDHAWFIAFAPYENPEIAMSVFIEHGGHGGTTAAPIAKKAIEYYLESRRHTGGEKKELL